MKKYLPYANYLAAAAGILGALLRQWTLSTSMDENGLYPAAHPGWIGYLLVMIAAAAVFFLMTRDPGKNGSWSANFPGGILPAMGQAAAACALVLQALPQLAVGDNLHTVSALLGLCGAAVLAWTAVRQLQGQDPQGLLHLLPCLFFALQLFLLGKTSSNETQLLRFLPQVLAFGLSALASYELAGFGADIGNRSRSLFWSLLAAALCLAAVPGGNWALLPLGLWHLLSHCTLTEPASEAEEAVEADEPAP